MTESPVPPTVLAIGAHPDDIEFLCAGTLALLRERGSRIVLATMTAGDLGSATIGREEIAAIRRAEARSSAAILDAEYYCVEYSDFAIVFGERTTRDVTALVRAVEPDMVLTHAPHDYLADHEETSRIVRQACFAAPVPNFETSGLFGDAGPTARIPHLYYCDPVEGIDNFGRPVAASLVVDISSTIDTKESMLAQHASQREWLRVQHGFDEYLERMREWSKRRGEQAGCPFGEGYRQHLGHAYPQDNPLKTVLGELVHEMAPY